MIRVKSRTDIITNSSSEVFCYIENSDENVLKDIRDSLIALFGYSQRSEIDPLAYIGERHHKKHIVIELPHSKSRQPGGEAFFRAGLQEFIKAWEDTKISWR